MDSSSGKGDGKEKVVSPLKSEVDNNVQKNKSPKSALEMLKETYDEELASSEEEDELLRDDGDDPKIVSKELPEHEENKILEESVGEVNSKLLQTGEKSNIPDIEVKTVDQESDSQVDKVLEIQEKIVESSEVKLQSPSDASSETSKSTLASSGTVTVEAKNVETPRLFSKDESIAESKVVDSKLNPELISSKNSVKNDVASASALLPESNNKGVSDSSETQSLGIEDIENSTKNAVKDQEIGILDSKIDTDKAQLEKEILEEKPQLIESSSSSELLDKVPGKSVELTKDESDVQPKVGKIPDTNSELQSSVITESDTDIKLQESSKETKAEESKLHQSKDIEKKLGSEAKSFISENSENNTKQIDENDGSVSRSIDKSSVSDPMKEINEKSFKDSSHAVTSSKTQESPVSQQDSTKKEDDSSLNKIPEEHEPSTGSPKELVSIKGPEIKPVNADIKQTSVSKERIKPDSQDKKIIKSSDTPVTISSCSVNVDTTRSENVESLIPKVGDKETTDAIPVISKTSQNPDNAHISVETPLIESKQNVKLVSVPVKQPSESLEVSKPTEIQSTTNIESVNTDKLRPKTDKEKQKETPVVSEVVSKSIEKEIINTTVSESKPLQSENKVDKKEISEDVGKAENKVPDLGTDKDNANTLLIPEVEVSPDIVTGKDNKPSEICDSKVGKEVESVGQPKGQLESIESGKSGKVALETTSLDSKNIVTSTTSDDNVKSVPKKTFVEIPQKITDADKTEMESSIKSDADSKAVKSMTIETPTVDSLKTDKNKLNDDRTKLGSELECTEKVTDSKKLVKSSSGSGVTETLKIVEDSTGQANLSDKTKSEISIAVESNVKESVDVSSTSKLIKKSLPGQDQPEAKSNEADNIKSVDLKPATSYPSSSIKSDNLEKPDSKVSITATDLAQSETKSESSDSQVKRKDSPEPTKRVKLVRPVFASKPPVVSKQTPVDAGSVSAKQPSVASTKQSDVKDVEQTPEEIDNSKKTKPKEPVNKEGLYKPLKKEENQKSEEIQVQVKTQTKTSDSEKTVTIKPKENVESSETDIKKVVQSESTDISKTSEDISKECTSSSPTAVSVHKPSLPLTDQKKEISKIVDLPTKESSPGKDQLDLFTMGDAQVAKAPESPKRVKLVRPVTKKPAKTMSTPKTSDTSGTKLLRERLEEKHLEAEVQPIKQKSDEVDEKNLEAKIQPIKRKSDEVDAEPPAKQLVIDKKESVVDKQVSEPVKNLAQTDSTKSVPVADIEPSTLKISKSDVKETSVKDVEVPQVPKELSTLERRKAVIAERLKEHFKKQSNVSTTHKTKQLEYTLKIGRASTTMIPKEEKSLSKVSQKVSEQSDVSSKGKPLNVNILSDSDVTITPIIAHDSPEVKKEINEADIKQEESSNEWRHLTDDVPMDTSEKKSDNFVERKNKNEDQESAILTTASGVKINIQSTPHKILNALISENQASSNSGDVQFVKAIPHQKDPKEVPAAVSNIKQEVMQPVGPPPKRRRGRPRKIPLESRPQMGVMGDEFQTGLFPVPLFDMSESMFTASGHQTIFPDQVVPSGGGGEPGRPQRTCRGRIKLPSVRTRKPRGSSMSGRVSASGRGRGRGYKRRFTEDENIITIDNVAEEMMRNKLPGRRRLSGGSRMDDDDDDTDDGKRDSEEDDRKLTKAERIQKRKEERKLRLLEKKRLKLEAREKEKAAAISGALADEETRMSAPERDGHDGLYGDLLDKSHDGEVTPTPRGRKRDPHYCCICLEETPLKKLTSPLDHRSWTVLYEAAIVRQHEPILKLTDDIAKEIPPTVLYHRNCRSEFTHKKTLQKLTESTVSEFQTSELQNAEQNPNSSKEFTVDQIAEYQWPLQGGELFMIQEQISTYLGVKSFKRKYPDIKRRAVEMEERQFLCDNCLVSESLCDLGLTAVSSAEVLDIMFADFPEKYEEFRKHIREKQARELSSKQKAALCSLLGKKLEQRTDSKQEAIQSTANWNSNLNKNRTERRKSSLDLQSLVIHYPKTKGLKMCPNSDNPKRVGNYPVALIPGQFSDYYKSYTPNELRYYPLDTVLYGPVIPNEIRHGGGSDGSQTDSNDSSSSDDSSDTSSEGTQDTEGTLEEDDKEIREKERQMDEAHCKACGGDKTRNKQDQPEVLIHCAQCTKSSHPTCVSLTVLMVPHIRRYDWQCTDCKTCYQCKDPADEDKMLFCDLCDRGYHIYCVGLRKVPMGRWHCQVCSVCNSCGTTDPGGPDWQHEYKKGEKNTRIYIQTLCGACSKLWRKGRYCQICLRCYSSNKPEEDTDLVQCSACDRWMHAECCRTTGSNLYMGSAGILCESCQERALPKCIQRTKP